MIGGNYPRLEDVADIESKYFYYCTDCLDQLGISYADAVGGVSITNCVRCKELSKPCLAFTHLPIVQASFQYAESLIYG